MCINPVGAVSHNPASVEQEESGIKDVDALGFHFGTGSQKDVFHSPESAERCFCLIRNEDIGQLSALDVAEKEIKDMRFLEANDLPVVKSFGVIKHGENYGVEREFIPNALDSEDVIHGKRELPGDMIFNEKVKASCDCIIHTLEAKNIQIDDLQFLIDEFGNVLINDAREAEHGNPQKSIDKVKELRGFAVGNLLELALDSDSDSD